MAGKLTQHLNYTKPTLKNTDMKLILTALCASFMVIPAAFADECEKGKCDKEKQEEGTLAEKCEKDGDCDKEKKEEGTLAEKCEKDGDCDKEKKEEGTLA